VKRLLCTAALVACAHGLMADSMNPQNPPSLMNFCTAVFLESPDYCFEASFTGLGLQPLANNLDYAAEAVPFNYGFGLPVLSPSWVIPEINTDIHFGFDVGIAGTFHGANSSLMLNWERFHSSNDSGTFTVSSSSFMIGPFFEIGPDASVYKTATGQVNFHFDEVNLDYGTFVRFGNRLHLNLFAGASFARLKQHRFTQWSNLEGTTVRTIDIPSKFTGAGPQVGVNFDYRIAEGFQFVGHTRATLFVGTFKNSTTFTTVSPILAALGDPLNVQSISVFNRTGMAPGFEGKLGLSYECWFGCYNMFKIEAGYQAQVYLNSIRSIDLGSEVALNALGSIGSAVTGVYARSFERTVSDFALVGPYATVYVGF